ncbi:hypothetical protein FS749_016013 [Ceratobasidium sp. UAMH 11750]|nr:hypothetical protein FS749_016013 [Ceratobasidium sp. UAMH 11750]
MTPTTLGGTFMGNPIIVAVGAVGTSVLYILWRNCPAQLLLPPSPRSYPLIGNLLSLPVRNEHLGFLELGEELRSDVVSLSMLGTVIIVLNKHDDAINLLERRSNVYSDRPRFPMISEPSLMDWGNLTAVARYGTEAFHPSQQHQSRLLLKRLLAASDHLNSSEDLDLEVYRATTGAIMCSVYGFKTEDLSDNFILKVKKTMGNLTSASLPSNFLVNVFPALIRLPDWFPWTSWKRTAKKWREQKDDAVDSTYYWAKSAMASRQTIDYFSCLLPT